MKTQPLYIVLAGQVEVYSVERNLPDMTWDATVRDIARGEFNNLHSVVEVSTGADVTEKAVRAAVDIVSDYGESTVAFAELVELTLGTRAARPFFVRAA